MPISKALSAQFDFLCLLSILITLQYAPTTYCNKRTINPRIIMMMMMMMMMKMMINLL